ncbi:Modification methylase BanI [[Actinobacillus] rossii]|uniref:DNA (cytosine-5-)-methyltransferase n=1 Tax=[Actinobacillus] rossii TaxID=123820 RepID=A0A380U0F7_9PAST|nr:Modification methylase BanI [[Actinobacillus] rossii]
MFTYGSICSGIEAVSVAWQEIGKPLWFSEIEPFPCAVLAHHYPDVPNLGDMTTLPQKILNREIPTPDVLVGGTPCFTAGHMVLTDKGYMPIETLSVGDLVVTHQGRLKPILRVGSEIKQVGKLTAVGLPEPIVCTPEHPFYAQKWQTTNTKKNGKYHRKTIISEPEWIEAHKLEGYQWVSLTDFSVMPYGGFHSKLTDEDVLLIAGYYLGDGWIRRWKGKNKKAVVISVNKEKYRKFSLSFAKLSHHITTENNSVIKITICDTELADFLYSQFGEKAGGKTIPAWCLSHSFRSKIFEGYMITDGSFRNGVYTANSISKSLAYGIAALSQTLGYTSSVSKVTVAPTKEIQGRIVNQNDYYQMRAFLQSTSRKSRLDENRLLRSVQSFEITGNEVVYNIEVADDNSYILNNAVVHNCQAFSVAGKRESLDDERGNLTLTLIHILEAIDYVRKQDGKQPCVLVWENVPGVLSTKDNAFGHFLAGLVQECQPLQPPREKWTDAGYVHSARTVCWRTLNAQYFGVAQRRKRVFLVASARKRSIAQVLIECKSVRGHFTTSESERKAVTGFIETSFGAYRQSEQGGTLKASGGVLSGGSETLIVHGTQDHIVNQNIAHCLGRNSGQENVLFDIAHRSDVVRVQDTNTLTSTDIHAISTSTLVRKLTPIECERLQGFPDNYTQIPYRNKPAEDCPDSPRYKAIGNSMAVPVMEWIGLRLQDYLTMEKTK